MLDISWDMRIIFTISLGMEATSGFINRRFFDKMKDLLLEVFLCERFSVYSPNSTTTMEIYLSYTETMPPPKVELKYTDRDWILIWKRINSDVLSQPAKNHLYLIVHKRVPTNKRLHRIMRNVIGSPSCKFCQESESQLHKYVQCPAVSEGCVTVRGIVEAVDINLIFESDHSLLHLYYNVSQRENALLWVIGEYVALVDLEANEKQSRLSQHRVLNFLRSKISEYQYMASPDLGFIPGLSSTGIG